jgi:hypothetical protein
MQAIRCPRCGASLSRLEGESRSRSLITDSFSTSMLCARCGEIPLRELPDSMRTRIERQRLKMMLILFGLGLLTLVLMFMRQRGFSLIRP